MLERILVPLDGSSTAEAVLKHVRSLLLVKDAEVLLLHVVPVLPAFEGAWREAPSALAALQDKGEAYVDVLRSGLESQGARVRGVVRVGFPAETILDYAERENSTLIVMTTHGRTGLSRWALGSVAEKILRAGPVPVLAVRSFAPGPSGDAVPTAAADLRFRKLLMCVDNSDLILKAQVAGLKETGPGWEDVLLTLKGICSPRRPPTRVEHPVPAMSS